ncbi:iron uptake porin [filamentous cyanobacterium LEGE 11480]|uniref:Iron uptake porin n=1 Tax=Romeriopsis navalis LEGE 11480 TaxID=2777977 RepID=A0A928VIG9_9CYAN|nr:iron uptake porin [Romeriopsis navalis]MBE9028935.1 iron uptake porin [Romeriopsis navalis LEGE 11480]
MSKHSLSQRFGPQHSQLKQQLISPLLVGANLLLAAVAAPSAIAQSTMTTIDQLSRDRPNSMGQVTSVSQLSDVRPTDWAFQSMQSLVERYGCIAGYPDRSFRGNRAITRFEFAAGMNACLDRIQQLIGVLQDDLVKKEDLATVQKLQSEFAAELATLRGRVDAVEAKTATLEKQQFSTTTKLYGEVGFSVSGALGGDKADGSGDPLQESTVLNNRVRLFFNSSFTGKDLLITRLDALNSIPFGPGEEGFPNVTGTSMSRLAFDEDSGNSVRIGKLFYQFGVGKSAHSEHDHSKDKKAEGDDGHGHGHGHGHGSKNRLTVSIDAVGGEFNENFANLNEYFSEELTGAISRFGRFNPIYYQGLEGTGASVNYELSEKITLSAGYLSPTADSPNDKEGLFDGSFAALAQLTIEPVEDVRLAFTYARSFFPGGSAVVSGETGSEFSNEPFEEAATAADNFGIQASAKISPAFTLSGWAGLTRATAQSNDGAVQEGDDASIFNWAATFAFPDFGKRGNLLGFIVGQPPRVTRNDVAGREDGTSAWHLEAMYRYKVNQNISVTPGLLVILNPEHNSNNDTILVGTIKTVFQF